MTTKITLLVQSGNPDFFRTIKPYIDECEGCIETSQFIDSREILRNQSTGRCNEFIVAHITDSDIAHPSMPDILADLASFAGSSPLIVIHDSGDAEFEKTCFNAGVAQVLRLDELNARTFSRIVNLLQSQFHYRQTLLQLESIFDGSEQAIIILDANARIEAWNPSAERLFEWTAADTVGRDIGEIIAEIDNIELVTRIKKLVDFDRLEMRVRCRSGRRIDVAALLAPVRDSRDEVSGFSLMASDITEYIKAEKTLELRESQYRSLIDNAPLGILLYNAEGDVLLRNDLIDKMFARIVGLRLKNINVFTLPALSYQGLSDRFRETFKDGRTHHLDIEFDTYSNGVMHARFIILPIRNKSGDITAAQAIIEDVTEHYEFLNALKKNLREREQILSSLGSILIMVDSNDRIVYWNTEAERIFGIERKNAVKKKVYGIQLSWNWATLIRAIPEALHHDRPVRIDSLDYVRPDGTHGILGVSVSPVKGDSEKRTDFMIIGRDITERVQIQAALSEQQAQMKAIFDNANIGIAMLDAGGAILRMNNHLAEMFGINLDDTLGSPFLNLIDESKCPYACKASDFKSCPLFQTEEGTTTIETELTSQKGLSFWANLSITPVFDKTKKVVAYVCIVIDISDQKAFESQLLKQQDDLSKEVEKQTRRLTNAYKSIKGTNEELKNASVQKDLFLASVNHELRTPLNGIIGFSDLLSGERYGPLNDKQKEYVKLISSSGTHLFELISDLLDVVRFDAGKMTLAREALRPDEFIRPALSMLQNRLNKKHIKLEQTIDDTIVVNGDSRRCKQVIINLLTNAIKYTPDKGLVQISASKQADGMALFTVRDSGVGIPESMLNQVFSDFSQVDVKRDSSLGGIGIGLGITRRIIDYHGGKIWAQNAPDGGAVFFFTLPLDGSPIPKKDGDESLGYELPRIKKDAKILIAEDDEINMTLMLDILSLLDVKVNVARNGQEAIDLLLAQPADLAIMDIRMPVMDGLTAIRRIREMEAGTGKRLPILTLSASSDRETQTAARAAGCDDTMLKPVATDKLFSLIEKYIGADLSDTGGQERHES
ncbi:MAG: PAS domain S-box protein [Planctomycetota bacterium]